MPTARRQTKTTRPARLLKGLGNAKRNEASPTLSIASTVSNLPRAGGPASPSSRPVALRLAPRAWPDANLKTPDETARPARRLKGLGNAKRNEASPTLSTSSIGSIESNRPLAGTGFPAPRPVAWRLAPRAWPDAKRKTPDENAATRAAPQRPRKREAERGDPDFVDFVDCVDCVEPAARRGLASPHRGRSSCVWRLAPGPPPTARRQTKTTRPARRLKGLENAKRNEASPTLSTSSIASTVSNRPLAGGRLPRTAAGRLASGASRLARRQSQDARQNGATRARKTARGPESESGRRATASGGTSADPDPSCLRQPLCHTDEFH